MLFAYIDTKYQRAASFACNQLVGVVWTFKNKGVGAFKLPHDFVNNLAKCHITCGNNKV